MKPQKGELSHIYCPHIAACYRFRTSRPQLKGYMAFASQEVLICILVQIPLLPYKISCKANTQTTLKPITSLQCEFDGYGCITYPLRAGLFRRTRLTGFQLQYKKWNFDRRIQNGDYIVYSYSNPTKCLTGINRQNKNCKLESTYLFELQIIKNGMYYILQMGNTYLRACLQESS